MSDLVSTLALALESSKFNAGLKESGDLVDGLGNRTAHMTQTLKTASIALAGLFASSKVIGFTRSVINAASQAQDLDLKFRTVFKSIGYEAEKTSLKIQKEFNRTTGSAQQLLLTTGNVLTSMGIGQRTALQFAGKISELSIQIAALHGISEEAVSDAFSSAMMGQTRSLRSYGIAIEESALKAEIATQKKKGVIFATEKEARANAILTLSFKQSHNAIAAYSNISERYSEQSRKFQENLGELQEAIGDAFTKPAARVLSFANKYIEKFTSLDQSTIAFVSTVGLGVTSLGILASGYKIVTGVIGTYNAIQQAATAAQAIATEATKNNTAASTIDTETTLAHATATATDRTEVALRTSTIGKSVTTEKLAATETAKWTAALKANTATSATNRNEIATRTLAIDKIIATEKLATIETAKWTKALSLNANRFKNSEQIQLRSTVVKETATAEKFAAAETAKWTKALTLNASRFKNSKQIQLRATVIKEVATAEELVTVATNTWTTALQANSVALTQNIALAEKLASINPAALATQTVAGTAQTAIPANANTVPVTTAAKPITTAANRTIKIANDAAQTASQTAQTANNAATTATHTATTATRAATTATNAATVATRTAQTVTQTVTLGMANAGNHVSTMVAGNNVATNMNSASVGLNSVIMAGSALTPARKAIAAPATSLTQVPVPHPPKIPVPYQRVPVPHPPIDNVSKLYAASFLPFRKLADASRYVGGGIATGAKSLAFSTYNNVLPSMIAGGRSAVLNPGRTLATAALGVPNMIAGVPVRGVGLLTKSFSGLSKTLTTLAKHIPFVGKAFAGFLGPVGAIVGIGAGIWAGLKALKAAPMALEWVIDKVSNIFTKENISKVFSSALSMGKNVLSGAANLVAGAWHGIEEVGLRTIFAGVNFFSETKYKTDTQILYQQNKKISEQQEELNKRRLEIANREKEIMAVRMATAESEEKWYEIQKRINAKRMDIAIERFSPKEQQEYIQEQIDRLAPKVYDFEKRRNELATNRDTAAQTNETAKQDVKDIAQDDPIRKTFGELMDKYNNNYDDVINNAEKTVQDQIGNLIKAQKAENEFNSINNTLMREQEEYEENKAKLIEMEAKKSQLKFDIANNITDLMKRKSAYQEIQNQINEEINKKEKIVKEQNKGQNEINRLNILSGKFDEEENRQIEEDKKKLEQQFSEDSINSSIAILRAYRSDSDKAQEEIEKIKKEQMEKYKKYSNQLFDFQFSTATKPQQQKMAVQKFWDENNNFGGLESMHEREEAVERMKEMYDKIDKSEMPTWNGVRHSTASAVESGSVQARELQNRILNDINKALLDNSKEQTVLQKALLEAMKELVKMSDPHYVGGST